MTTKTLQYIGTDEYYFESAVTGRAQKWSPGQRNDVPTAAAALLLATGQFRVSRVPAPEYSLDPTTGAVTGLVGPDGRNLTIGLPRAVAMRHLGRVLGPASGGFLNSTFRVCFTVPFGFEAVRLWIGNQESSQFTGVIASMAATSGTSETVLSGGTWAQCKVGAATSLNVPAGSSGVPTYAAFDWLRVSPLLGSDGKRRLLVNIYLPTVGYTYFEAPTDIQSVDKQNGLPVTNARMVGDYATVANAGSWTEVNRSSVMPAFALEFSATAGGMTVLGAGDSIMWGQDSATATGQGYGWLRRAVDDVRSVFGGSVGYINEGWAGQTTGVYSARAKETVTVMKPTVAVYAIGSPNDGAPSESVVNVAIARAIDFAQHCQRNGTLPIYATQTPRDNYDATADGWRLTLNNWAKNSGIPTIDVGAAVADGATPNRFISGYSADGLHPGDTGKEAMRAAAASALALVLPRVVI